MTSYRTAERQAPEDNKPWVSPYVEARKVHLPEVSFQGGASLMMLGRLIQDMDEMFEEILGRNPPV